MSNKLQQFTDELEMSLSLADTELLEMNRRFAQSLKMFGQSVESSPEQSAAESLEALKSLQNFAPKLQELEERRGQLKFALKQLKGLAK